MSEPKRFSIAAADGWPLAATLFPGTGPGTVVIGSASGVKRRFYEPFAAWLSSRGPSVLTFDYRGIGDSRHHHVRQVDAAMRHWGELDLDAALAWGRDREGPLFYIGHSVGGQVFGLAQSNRHVTAAVTVGAGYGYWGNYRHWRKPALFLAWHLAMPTLVKGLGYFPARRLGMGEDLPPGIALEWARWGRDPDHLMGRGTGPSRANFAAYRGPLLAYAITDDGYLPPRAVAALHANFTGARLEMRHLHPDRLGLPRLGHFGFFREARRDTLWREAADWLLAKAAGDAAAPA